MTKKPLNNVLHQLMHAYKQLLAEEIHRHQIDLPVTHIRILKGVHYQAQTSAQCTANAIAEFMQRDKAQITRALNTLIDSNLIVKLANPLDGRSQLLRLTAEGAQIVSQIQAIDDHVLARLTQDLDADSLAVFLKVSRTMIANASKLSTKANAISNAGNAL